MTADDPTNYVTAYAFLHQDPDHPENDVPAPDGTAVEWSYWSDPDNAGTGEAILESDSTFTDGIAVAKFKGTTVVGDRFTVTARIPHCEASATSGILEITPGLAAEITFQSDADVVLPIEGQTFNVTATVKDAHGNFVDDGTPAIWLDSGLTCLGSDETPIQESISEGKVTAQVVTGPIAEDQAPWLLLQVDNYEQFFNIDLTPIVVALFTDVDTVDVNTGGLVHLRATFKHSGGQNVTAGTSISWKTTNGTFTQFDPQINANGEAFAILSSVGGRRGTTTVSVMVGQGGSYGVHGDIQFTSSARASSELDPGWVVVDDAAFASNLLITGPPGGRARVTVGDADRIVAQYPCDRLVTIALRHWLADASYGHDAEVFGTNPAVDPNYGLHLDGSIYATINATEILQISQGLFITLTIRTSVLPTSGQEMTLLEKSGEYSLKLINDGSVRVRWTVITESGLVTTAVQSDPLSGGPDFDIQASFFAGAVTLAVSGGNSVSSAAQGVIQPGLAPISIGSQFNGYLRNLVFSRRRRLLIPGLDENNEVSLGDGDIQLALQPELPLDSAQPDDANPEDTDLGIWHHRIGITVYGPPGDPDPPDELGEDVYAIRHLQAKNMADGLGDLANLLASKGKAIIKFFLPIEDVQYLASLAVGGSEFDFKKTTFALANIAAVLFGPLSKGGKLLLLLKPGKGAVVLARVYRGAMIARNAASAIQFAELIDFAWQLGEAYKDKLLATAQSKHALDQLKELYDSGK